MYGALLLSLILGIYGIASSLAKTDEISKFGNTSKLAVADYYRYVTFPKRPKLDTSFKNQTDTRKSFLGLKKLYQPMKFMIESANKSDLMTIWNKFMKQTRIRRNRIDLRVVKHQLKLIVTSIFRALVKIRRPPSLRAIRNFQKDYYNLRKTIKSNLPCTLCHMLMLFFQLHMDFIVPIFSGICHLYLALATLQATGFCRLMLEEHKPTLVYIREHSKILNPAMACSIFLQTKECTLPDPSIDWTVPVDKSKPRVPQTDPYECQDEPIRILHLTDIHITPDYEENSMADCGYPLCCVKGIGNKYKSKRRAGYWGDYECDLSPQLMNNAFRAVSKTFDISMVYYTGDTVDHEVWKKSRSSNEYSMAYVNERLYKYFPHIPVINVLGNHESHPLNVFPPKEQQLKWQGFDVDWLYRTAATLWEPWLPKKALRSLKHMGYYAYTFNEKLKVIAMNNNLCYNFNWWLFYNTTYMREQLEWIQNELLESERNGQFVHIIGHNNFGDEECIAPWEESYADFVTRFKHIITGQFTGHTHTDELKIFYDNEPSPINVAFNGGSLTPYIGYNPNFKIVDVCPRTMKVCDIHTYVINLTDANAHSPIYLNWFKLYSMKSEYDLQDLSPESMDRLSYRMFLDPELRRTYWRNFVRYGDLALKGESYENTEEAHCKMTITRSRKPTQWFCNGSNINEYD